MAQHDYVIDNGGGATVRSDINAALQAILTSNSGPTEPTVTRPYMLWNDTTDGALKIRNATDTAWVLFSAFTLPDGGITAPKLSGAQSGSAPAFAARAWARVGFDYGTTSVILRRGGNVSSITRIGTGSYFVNFTTSMQDTDYAVNVTASFASYAAYSTNYAGYAWVTLTDNAGSFFDNGFSVVVMS